MILFDEKFNQLKETTSDAEGKYEFTEVICGTKYFVRASLEDYTTKEVSVIIGKETGKTELNIELKTTTCKVKIGDDLADCFKINIIYFDLDKWNIRPDAAVDLAKLLDVLNQNPSMKINIPPSAPDIGNNALLILESSPAYISRSNSKPINKKKIVINPSFIQWTRE